MTHTNNLFANLDQEILSHVQLALNEDIPDKDITTDSLGLSLKNGHAKMLAKQDLYLSGCSFVNAAFLLLDHETEFLWHFNDGEEVLAGQSFLELKGNLLCFLKAERVALNYLGKFSGIATMSAKFVEEVKHTKCKILDTRKTTPLFRTWEKKAVLDGGATNHRMNLSDAVLIKENHILASGNIEKAVKSIRSRYTGPIELETQSFDDVKKAVELKVDRVLLDNMSNQEIEKCLAIIPKSIKTEASGNMSLDRVKSVAELGVDYISVGAITHSAPCADISLLFDWTI